MGGWHVVGFKVPKVGAANDVPAGRAGSGGYGGLAGREKNRPCRDLRVQLFAARNTEFGPVQAAVNEPG